MKLIVASDLGKRIAGIDKCSGCGTVYVIAIEDLRISIAVGHNRDTGMDFHINQLHWTCDVCDRDNIGSEEIQNRQADVRLWIHMQKKAETAQGN